MDQIRKIQSMGTAIRVISIILRVLLGIFAVMLLAAIVALITASIVLPAEYQTLDMAFELDLALEHPLFAQMEAYPFITEGFSATSQDSSLLFDFTSGAIPCRLTNLWALLITPLLQMIAWFIVLCHVGKFAKALKNSYSPFTAEISTRLKRTGWAVLFATVLPTVIGTSVMSFVLSNNVNLTINIDLTMVLFVLLFLMLTYIFAYGAKLQEESDTTL